ncbi:12619_t:CDS:2 [Dentiscutata heterogama]|uniref:12619_t:CDS:1 n=1 Tax=Dentiscutata heterogama TaxID=1316150 RepID=A0ACA9KKI8_9GLOM|nr:12619_t:CDS:2 [Dentiscutata heterogama]
MRKKKKYQTFIIEVRNKRDKHKAVINYNNLADMNNDTFNYWRSPALRHCYQQDIEVEVNKNKALICHQKAIKIKKTSGK